LGGQTCSAKNSGKNPNNNTGYTLYFGDLHSHTSLSDGTGDPYDAFRMGMEGEADFMALSEHVQFWNAYDAWIMDAEDWEYLKQAAIDCTTDTFVAIPAYETWMLANCGEVNVYNVPDLPDPTNLGYRFDRLPNFYDWLNDQPGGIGQFNHPLYVSDNFMDYDFYNEARDVGMCIIEAYNAEYYDESYTLALDAGWHVMPSSNSDTHYADWIVAHEMRTVLLAESLTDVALYDAMRECRGYATLDKNLRIEYTLDGAVMGSNLSNPDGSYDVWMKIEDPDGTDADRITLVEIVTDGGVVIESFSFEESTTSETIECTLDSEDARYFFVRVTTASPLNLEEPGITAWTSPVWTGM